MWVSPASRENPDVDDPSSRPGRRPDPALHELWRKRLARFQQSGLSVADFCARERLSLPSFYAWRRRPRANPTPAPTPASPRFLPVRLSERGFGGDVGVGGEGDPAAGGGVAAGVVEATARATRSARVRNECGSAGSNGLGDGKQRGRAGPADRGKVRGLLPLRFRWRRRPRVPAVWLLGDRTPAALAAAQVRARTHGSTGTRRFSACRSKTLHFTNSAKAGFHRACTKHVAERGPEPRREVGGSGE